MHRGYTKAWRKEIDSMIWGMPPLYHRVFFYLRLKVNWKPKLFPTRYPLKIWVSPGMILTSCSQIAEGVSYKENNREITPDRKTIMRVLEWLRDENMIQLACHTNGTTIFLNNWSTYNVEDAELVPPIPCRLDTTKESKRKIKKKTKNKDVLIKEDIFLKEKEEDCKEKPILEEEDKLPPDDIDPEVKVNVPVLPQPNEVIKVYCDRFKEVYGINPHVTPKDVGISVRLCQIPDILNLIDLFFKSQDSFILKSKHNIMIFESQINKLLVAGVNVNYSGIQEWLQTKQ